MIAILSVSVAASLALAAPQAPSSTASLPPAAPQGRWIDPGAQIAVPHRGHRAVVPVEVAEAMPIARGPSQVVIKLAENRPGLATAEQITDARLLETLGSRAVQPMFAGLEAELAHLRARQQRASAQAPAVDLGLYFVASATDARDARSLIERCNALAEVEIAYPREQPTPPPGHRADVGRGDILPVTPDYTSQQSYRAAAPSGIDGAALLSTVGGSGAGLTVLDIEWGWNFDHEDLATLRPASRIGPTSFSSQFNDHGVASVGILSADADQYGVTGLVPDAGTLVTTNYPATGYSVAAAILRGLPSLSPGDVILLEAQANTPFGFGPVEYVQADFDAILVATNLGILTIEPSGNGSISLDQAGFGGIFDPAVRDSGAIFVGASIGPSLNQIYNYGARVDTNGWGSSVTTTGYGGLFLPNGDARQSYTATFGGTSSASAIVAGVVTGLRGAAVAQLSPTAAQALDGFAIRSLLRQSGTAMAPGTLIGTRPDARELLDLAGITRGLEVRGEPSVGGTCTVELTPPFAAGPLDFYGMVGGFSAVNLPLPRLFADRSQGRLVIDPTATEFVEFDTFGSSGGIWTVNVPANPAFLGIRYFVQGYSIQSATSLVFSTNAVQLLVRT